MNYWAMLSFFPGILNLLLGAYVLYRDPKRLLNITFALFVFSLAIWSFSEFGHRLATNPEIAYLWIRSGGIGWCFMNSLWLHFILIFARREKILKNKLTYIGLYVPPLVILYLFLAADLIYKQEPVKMYFGYTVQPGELIWIYTVYYILLYIFIIYFIWEVIRKGLILEKKQAKPMLVGSALFLVSGTGTNVILPKIGITAPELGTTFSIIWVISVFYAVIKHKLFIIEPSIEELNNKPQKYTLKRGLGYLVKEETPDKGYEIFYDQITHGGIGLCITKLEPEKVRERYKLAKTPIIWLSFNSVESAILPKDRDGLTSIVSDFVRKTEGSLLFFDCLDQIKLTNGFEKSLSMLKDFRKLCNENNSIMLISVFPRMFENQQLAVIEKELEEI